MIDIKDIHFTQGDFSLHSSLKVNEGELLTLLGPSGSGKTTLLRLIAGFLDIQEGSIRFKDKDISHLPPYQRDIGFLFQDLALFPHMTVEKNILFGLDMQKRNSSEKIKILNNLLELIGLQGFEKRPIHQLSGGEKQRVALARAIAPGPRCLLLDEPLSALDVEIRKRLGKEIRTIQQQKGLTTLWVTHDQEQAMNISDRICLIKDGSIIETGTPEDLYQRPKNPWTALFLGEGTLLPFRKNGEIISTPWGDLETDQEVQDTGQILLRPEWISLEKPGASEKSSGKVMMSSYGQRGYRIEGTWKGYPFSCYHKNRLTQKDPFTLRINQFHLLPDDR